MSVKCQVVLDALERLAPKRLAEEWDHVGLMLGSPAREVHKVFVCLDVYGATIEAAKQAGADLMISHHPFVFKPLRHLRTDLPQGKWIESLFQNDIAVYSAHTNLDIAEGGVNDVLAERLGLKDCSLLAATEMESVCKLAVYVPISHLDAVREAVFKAGAGQIGAYSQCSFQVQGKGTFLPLENTNPFIGTPGRLETVDEVRLETVLPEKSASRVVKALLKAHPYEEVAYDLYDLKHGGRMHGIGRIGRLEEAVSAGEFAAKVKTALPVDHVRLVGAKAQKVQKIALCGGAGAEYIAKAIHAGADLMVTGDVKYHEAQKALENGICLVDAGHFGTEFPVVEKLAAYLAFQAKQGKWGVEIDWDRESKDVFTVV